ncbi:MAG: methionyl-tRNA formyltransferase [Candidatus Pacebacteria bacterium]|nr:methionyl-tRNA formyltransferase [Candidatus Paceibacterota bacterium]
MVTKPDTPIGRHQIITPPYIKEWAKIKNIKVLQPQSLKKEYLDKEENKELKEQLLRSDINIHIVASYGKIIPEYLLNIPSAGFINIHPSDLPQYRGASPIQYALLDGKKEIFVTIMKLNKDMDEGDILIQQPLFIEGNDNTHTLEIKSGQIGGELIYKILEAIINNNIKSITQDHNKATYTKMIDKNMGEISLNDNIEIIKNKYRAFTP